MNSYYVVPTIIAMLTLLFGMWLGWKVRDWHDLEEKLNKLIDGLDDKPGLPKYFASASLPSKPTTRIVTPKTPQRVEWEEQNKRRDEALNHDLPLGPR